MRLMSKIMQWIQPAVQLKPHCSLYYKNEKIRSCKNMEEAERHIKQIYTTVCQKFFNKNVSAQQTSEPAQWSDFRDDFKVKQDN
jgi:hypothetical protein